MMLGSPAERALTAIELARDGRFVDVHGLFAQQLRPMVSPEALRAAWDAEIARLGPVSSVGTPVTEPGPQNMVVVKVLLTCERGALAVVATLTAAGQLAGIQLAAPSAAVPAAPWVPADYVSTDHFEEEEVSLGSGPLAVRGTFSTPKLGERGPGIVLLAGSGPSDRDETIGRNKPLKDLAWGLASRGVAVLRFDKVTFAHPGAVKADLGFTVADEYIPHATAALRILSSHTAVDHRRVFLGGHSLGATIAPRVAAAGPSIAGLALLAAGAQPLHWAAVRQVRYLASLNPGTFVASQPVIDTMTEQAERVDSAGLSLSTPPSELPFGTPPAYWLDLRTYQPAEVAANLGKPVLILHGGRDYQVTVDDDLAIWQRALDGRPDVTIRVYPADNHLFFPGSGPSTPAEYEPVQHMDPQVVSDLADWLKGRAA